MPWSIIIPAVLSSVGAGVSYVSATNAAKTQETLAFANAQTQRQGIEQTGQVNQMQAALNQRLAEKNQEAQNANANAITANAELATKSSMESIRRSRVEAGEAAAQQVATLAKSGFADTTGSPLRLLADTAQKAQMQADALRYEDEQARRGAFMDAAQTRNQGILAGLNAGQYQLAGMASKQETARNLSQSRLNYYAQRATAGAARTQAVGGLINSIGGLSYRAFGTYNDIH